MGLLKRLFPISAAAVMAAGLMIAAPSAEAQLGYEYNPGLGYGYGVTTPMGYGAYGGTGLWDNDLGYSEGIFGDTDFYTDYNDYYGVDWNDDEWFDWW